MGSACCVAAKDRTPPNRIGSEYSHRNIRYSPSWSFRWESRTHNQDGMDNHAQFSRGDSHSAGLEIEAISDAGSPVGDGQMPTWQKSVSEGTSKNFRTGASDPSMGSNNSSEENFLTKSRAAPNASGLKLSGSVPSTSSSSMFKAEPSSSRSHSHPTDQTPSRRARRSPGYQLSRQVSDSRIPLFKSQNDNSISEGRNSFVLSACSNDLTLGSHDGSSDGWSIMHTFSELVATSQRERWSFDSENMSSGHGKVSRSNSQPLSSPSIDLQACGICSKLLTERSSFSSQKIVANNELSVVAVLVCGHVYHAECLDNMTPETDKYDPSCPLCMVGERMASKMSRKASRGDVDSKARNKISRIGVADIDPESEKSTRQEGKGPKMGASSSMKSSFGRPFLRRHFSVGSRSTRSPLENEPTRRKGFWAKYR
ncbi:uncharacterized protein LOC131234336 [Magnolia sinica]|uniref:uncharacterized protein LOC131234336 n=1 Tax=Magnolia sinica TaxID=86752 RepID=UPI00265911FF|nr:uncharacterized protein LOC131234336 [Magnolia sinica]